jgi:tetrahydromethanopterin S-methyltransferase subunit C
VIRPGVVHVNLDSAFNTLPTPLLVLLAFLLVCALLVTAWSVRRRIRRMGWGTGGDSIGGE